MFINTYEFISIIPYCVRPEIPPTKFDDDQEKSCNGQKFMFTELKSRNISTADLFNWNAVIEIMDLYGKYLLLSKTGLDDEVYCNCTNLSIFGRYCKNVFIWRSTTFVNEVRDFIGRKGTVSNKGMTIDFVTCYTDIQCKNNILCLDWRQICNGIIDCEEGEDEAGCLELEMNECNAETEFRCKNGMCIPKSFAYDLMYDCHDQSDEQELPFLKTELCFQLANFECEENNIARLQIPCGDGHSISLGNLITSINYDLAKCVSGCMDICKSRRDFIYVKQVFLTSDQNECWQAMLCITGFRNLFPYISCFDNLIEHIQQFCPNDTYFFPSNPVVYSFVYFLYDKNIESDWQKYTGPNFICYNSSFCNITVPSMLIEKNNLTCFAINETVFIWKNFYEHIVSLFSSCYYSERRTPLIASTTTLYRCNITHQYISKHRVKDKKQDCLMNDDENSNINICPYNLNDHFKCFTRNETDCIQRRLVMDGRFDCLDGSDEYFGPTLKCRQHDNMGCRFLPQSTSSTNLSVS
ncbi:unnamed protein product [Didymodactylos carnosus]|uniref:Uncharacterized protein n=1 Tax=Didymodactylos carnosus TaxID=1234261 RepID=A0A814J6B7_9BILA|nr:unnamed protein product [Didymodactylos carnosus]CAF3802532.1 unnamed protein product [Didymodactylos carnosus]